MSPLDSFFYRLPLIGPILQRTHDYFRKNITYADGIHVALGIGIGLVIAGVYLPWAIVALLIGIAGHLYAFIRG